MSNCTLTSSQRQHCKELQNMFVYKLENNWAYSPMVEHHCLIPMCGVFSVQTDGRTRWICPFVTEVQGFSLLVFQCIALQWRRRAREGWRQRIAEWLVLQFSETPTNIYIVLHCTALHCTALHCTALHCTALKEKPTQLAF
jgi:hypothetical protein